MSKIVLIDDSSVTTKMLKSMLEKDILAEYVEFEQGTKALEYIKKNEVDLILTDINMPVMTGLELAISVKKDLNKKEVPIIFITGNSDNEDQREGFEAGGVDYIVKPFDGYVVQSRVKTHLDLRKANLQLKETNRYLEDEVKKRTAELYEAQDLAMQALANLAETRDKDTGGHIRRTQLYVKLLAEQLAKTQKYQDEINPDVIEHMYKSAPLHDIGKVGISDAILLKPGKLTEDEYDLMKAHTTLGQSTINRSLMNAKNENSFLSYAAEIAGSHHEKWDGSGYPKGLKEEQIPLSGRIMALADVYDALTSKRCYKEAFNHEGACKIIEESKGTHFDPTIVDCFLEIHASFNKIALQYID